MNWYEGGEEGLGAHADDETDLVKGAPIYSFSFGASRVFRVHPGKEAKARGEANRDFWLEHGDLVVMGGLMQQEYKHSVPCGRCFHGKRINLTIRAFRPIDNLISNK